MWIEKPGATAAKIIVLHSRRFYSPRSIARKFKPQSRVPRSQHFKPLLILAFVLLASTINADVQNKPSAADREKIEKERAERFKKIAAPLLAEAEQRRAIIRDLIDTCAKCRALGEACIDAVGDAAKDERISRERDQCHAVLEAKLARPPLIRLPHLRR